MSGTILERAWKNFFAGSTLFEDLYPEIKEEQRIGLEAGVDLFLHPQWRALLPTGMIQIKSSAAYALEFLEEGKLRGQIIPVVIGTPPRDQTPEKVLSRLAMDYCWRPSWKETGDAADELEALLAELCELPQGALLKVNRPKWAVDLA